MKRKLIASTTALALGATLAIAQEQPSPGSSQSSQSAQSSQSQQQPAAEASKEELKVSQNMQQHVTDINKASKLIGMQVRNTKNELLGKINDVVIDQKSGKVAYVAMSIGGVLGVGDKLVAVPFEALTPNQGQDGLMLNIEKQRLQQAPGFSQNNWPDLNAASQGKTIGIATGTQTEATGASGSQTQQQSGSAASSTSTNQPQQQPSQPPSQDQSGSDPEKKAGASGTEKEPSPPNSTP